MMKKMIIALLIIFYACGQNNSSKNSDNQIKKDNLSGVYEYVYPNNTPELTENHFIVLETTQNQLSGYYYGTSDEFDEEREGYLPAFFVAKMHNLKIVNDTINFTLIVNNDDFLTKAVDLKYKSTNDALKAGYKNWENLIPTEPKSYKGIFKNSSTIVFNEEDEFLTKTFKKR
jgi:hypothetical protein